MMSHEHGWSCSCWHAFGGLLWIAAVVALILAWVATSKGNVWGMDASQWYVNAMALGILAIPLKLKHSHGMGCGCGECK